MKLELKVNLKTANKFFHKGVYEGEIPVELVAELKSGSRHIVELEPVQAPGKTAATKKAADKKAATKKAADKKVAAKKAADKAAADKAAADKAAADNK